MLAPSDETISNEKCLVEQNRHDDYLFTPMTQSMSQTFDYSDEDFQQLQAHMNEESTEIAERRHFGSPQSLLSRGEAGEVNSQCGAHNILRQSMLDQHDENKMGHHHAYVLRNDNQIFDASCQLRKKRDRTVPSYTTKQGNKDCTSCDRLPDMLNHQQKKRRNGPCIQERDYATIFTSAGGRAIEVSEESMMQADAVLNGDSLSKTHCALHEQQGHGNGYAAMFSSAGGRAIEVSEESMKKADALLNGDSSKIHCALHEQQGHGNGYAAMFTSAGGRAIEVSEESMTKANAVLNGDSSKIHCALHEQQGHGNGNAAMFTSAGGRSIALSEESMMKADAVFNGGSPTRNGFEFKALQTDVSINRGQSLSSVTPIQTPYHRPMAVITSSSILHDGRPYLQASRHRHFSSYAPVTPVPINFRLYSNTKSRCAPSFLEGKVNQNVSTATFSFSPIGRKISLRDFTDKYCPLAKTKDVCVNTNTTKLLLDITSDNSANVRFGIDGHPACFLGNVLSPNMKLKGSVLDLRGDLINCGCDASLLNDMWIANHCRWIIWKLAAMERQFHSVLAGKYLTYRHLVHQLHKRYQIEIVRAVRPAIRKVLNRDIAASTCMILCVSKILDYKGKKGIRLVLTDGWYEIPAFIDEHLQGFVHRKKIVIGSKLLVCNAILEGADEGIDPLDKFYKGLVRSFTVRLKLFANCTRLCKWYTKLGFLKPSNNTISRGGVFGIHSINDAIPGGGPIPSIDLIICRRYPLLFLEEMRISSGSEPVKRIISEAENTRLQDKYEEEWNSLAEEMAENLQKVESEMDTRVGEDRLVESITARYNSLHQRQPQNNAWQTYDPVSTHAKDLPRKSTPFVRFKVKAWSDKLSLSSKYENEAVLTIWGPAEHFSFYQEGCVIRCNNLGVKSSAINIELVATNKTRIELLSPQPSLQSLSAFGYQPRVYDKFMYTEILSKSQTSNPLSLPEVDCAGCLVKSIETVTGLSIYLMDESQCLIRIEREIDQDDWNSVKIWKTGILGLPQGSFLCYRDVRLLYYDPWEECSVGVWTESSSQQVDTKRVSELSSWYTSNGHNLCQLARLKLDCGIVCNPPRKTAQIIGSICSFELQPTPNKIPFSPSSPLNLQNFEWAVSIDCLNYTVQAIISPMYQHKFANICNRSMVDVMKKDMYKDDLDIIVEYFSQQFLNDPCIFCFIVDTESNHIIDTIKTCPKKLVEYFSLLHRS